MATRVTKFKIAVEDLHFLVNKIRSGVLVPDLGHVGYQAANSSLEQIVEGSLSGRPVINNHKHEELEIALAEET